MEIQSRQGIKLTGFFRGIVLKHCSKGRIKVWIPGIYPNEFKSKADQLPYCQMATPLSGGSSQTNGMFGYPDVNAVVWCFFENEDYNKPICFATCTGKYKSYMKFDQAWSYEEERKEEFSSENKVSKGANVSQWAYGPAQIVMNKGGNVDIKLLFSEDKKDKNCSISMDTNGTIFIESGTGGIQMTSKGSISLYADKGVNICGQDTIVNSRNSTHIQGTKNVEVATTEGKVSLKSKTNQETK